MDTAIHLLNNWTQKFIGSICFFERLFYRKKVVECPCGMITHAMAWLDESFVDSAPVSFTCKKLQNMKLCVGNCDKIEVGTISLPFQTSLTTLDVRWRQRNPPNVSCTLRLKVCSMNLILIYFFDFLVSVTRNDDFVKNERFNRKRTTKTTSAGTHREA